MQLESYEMNLDMALVPHAAQFFGVWAIEERAMRSALQMASNINIAAHVQANQADAEARAARGGEVRKTGAVGVITLRNSLMKQVSSFDSGTSTVQVRRQLRAAVADAEIASILLHIDSPGGTVAGTKDLADDVAAAAKQKPVHAYIEDLGASAAYWIGSQASKVYANPTALVGSIGTFAVVYDLSQMADKEGVRVHVIRAGDFKGAGVPGTEVTDEQLAEMQRIVDDLNSHFLQGVAAGRGMKLAQVRELADGRVHVGKAAIPLGLIDGVQSLDATFAGLVKASTKPRGAKAMTESTETTTTETAASTPAVKTAPGPATLAELRDACPGASNDFLVEQLEQQATAGQAGKAWMKSLSEANAALAKERDALKASDTATTETATSPAPKKRGVEPLKSSTSTDATFDGDVSARVEELVTAKMAGGMPRHAAYRKVMSENEDLRVAMLVEHNTKHGRKKALAAADLI